MKSRGYGLGLEILFSLSWFRLNRGTQHLGNYRLGLGAALIAMVPLLTVGLLPDWHRLIFNGQDVVQMST